MFSVSKASTMLEVTLLCLGISCLPIVFPGEVSSARQVTISHVLWMGRRVFPRGEWRRSRGRCSAPPPSATYDTYIVLCCVQQTREEPVSQGGAVGGVWRVAVVVVEGWQVCGVRDGLTCRYRWTRRPRPSSWRSHTCNNSRPYRVFTCPVRVKSDIIRQLGMRKHTLGYKNKSYQKHS